MLVELDIFSGRPNPRWELDEPASREVRRRASGLTPATAQLPEPPGLGYRGFVYADPAGPARVYRGYLQVAGRVLADPTFEIERLLLEHLPPELATLRPVVARELGGGP
jgi:hypothetical protein